MFKSAVIFCLIVMLSVTLWADNPFGRALVLNGDRQYVEIPDSQCEALENLDVFTLEIRFKQDESRGFNLFNKIRVNSQGHFARHGWFVDINRTSYRYEGKMELCYIDPLEAFYAPDFIRLTRTYSNASGGWGMTRSGRSGPGLSSEGWHHFAMILSGGYKKFYVDGVSNGYGNSSPVDNAVTGASLNVGGFAESLDAPLDLSAYLHGQIDEFRIWNVVRTGTQINDFMNDTLSVDIYTSAESGLIGYYRFEELENLGIGNDGLANDVRDLSLSANHANVWNGGTLTEQMKLAGGYEIPVTFQRYENSVSSFEPSTKINFDLAEASPVDIKVYDTNGRLVSVLTENLIDAGSHDFVWASPKLPDGVYICKMKSNSFDKTIKMVLQK